MKLLERERRKEIKRQREDTVGIRRVDMPEQKRKRIKTRRILSDYSYDCLLGEHPIIPATPKNNEEAL
jgi:hypothetical protein